MFDIENASDEIGNFNGGAKIVVIGVGGGGCNAVNTMIREGLVGVKYVVANTDAQALHASLAEQKIQLGVEITKGLGAGANPEVGRQAAMEDYEGVAEVLKGADMVFITAGMGGGTGTGAAPVIAKLSRDLGALTVGVVTKPFRFEGKRRRKQAENGILELESCVDSLITIPNEKLLELAGEDLTLVETFRQADGVLLNAVRGISDLINNTGLINADFADVATVMANKGMALMGTGEAAGDKRAESAARIAINSPLLDDVSIEGATGIIVNISGDSSLTTSETNRAMNLIMDEADEDAEIIFGTVIDETLGDSVKVTVIATGLGGKFFADPISRTTPSFDSTSRNIQSERVELVAVTEPVVRERATFVEETVAPVAATTAAVDSTNPINEEEADAFLEESFSGFDIVSEKTAEEEVLEEPLYFDTSSREAAGSVESISEESKTLEAISDSDRDENFENDENIDNDERDEVKGFGRAKRIAQKLGFMNFDDDDFDKPAHHRAHQKESDH